MNTTPLNLIREGLTPSLQDILRRQHIEPGDPGPILFDLEAMMDVIGEGVVTASKYFALPQNSLVECNERLREPLAHQKKRPQLRTFPRLTGLFILLRASGLAVCGTKPRREIRIDPAARERWDDLNPTEKYMTLLELLLTRASLEILGEPERRFDGMESDLHMAYTRLHETSMHMSGHINSSRDFFPEQVALNLLHEFGWLRLTYQEKAEAGRTARLETIERLPFGDAMVVGTFSDYSRLTDDGDRLPRELAACFPEWKKSLTLPEEEFPEGEHILKVSLGKVWRRMAAPAETLLADLAYDILDAFDFDHDHVYEFEFRNRQGLMIEAVAPEIGDGFVFADQLCLGDLPLREGETFTFLYDFGDTWEFQITLEKISDEPSSRSGSEVVRKSGRPPQQYRDFDWH